ncbi:MAG: hypothetical protein GY713_15710 [Actinomycetia bacterium]|nr:hypothetical protein [Actinomycetes bacterium]
MHAQPLVRDPSRSTALRALALSACLLVPAWAVHAEALKAPTASFTASAQVNAESVTAVTVTVELSAAVGHEVEVPLTFSGTADDPDDYSPGTTTLVIPAGETRADLTLSVVDDDRGEKTELIDIKMGRPVGAERGDVTLHTVVIRDDD